MRKTYLESTTEEQRLDTARHLEALVRKEAERTGFYLPSDANIAGTLAHAANPQYQGFLSMPYLRQNSEVWGGEVSIQVLLHPVSSAKYGVGALTEISWSSTGRSLAQAVYTVSLYQNAIRLASYIETLLS